MLIGISGKKRSGKDTFFGILEKTLPDRVIKRYSFADGVREFAETYFKVPIGGWEDPSFKEENRFILQGIGQMMRDECDRLFWVRQVLDKYHADLQQFDGRLIGVITDVRYPNEADMVQSNEGFRLLRINRPGYESDDQHPSEISLDDYAFDHVINNDGDLATYEGRAKEWIQNVLL